MLLLDQFLCRVEQQANAPAFIFEGRVLSYREFHALCCAVMAQLQAEGIVAGQTVAVSMAQTPLHCAVLFALARMGAISMPLAPGLESQQKLALCRRHQVARLVSSWPATALEGLPTVVLDKLTWRGDETEPAGLPPMPGATTPLRIALTSGSSGEAKGVLHSHGGFTQRIAQSSLACDAGSRLLAPDLHITLSVVYVLGVLGAGGLVVFPANYQLHEVVRAISLHAVSHLVMIPAQAALLAAALPEASPSLPSLRHFRLVGAGPSPSLLAALQRKASSLLYVTYALTELGVIALADPELLRLAPSCAGRIPPWVRVEVLDTQGQTLPNGQAGELRLWVEGMPSGYVGGIEPAVGRFAGGWFYPGDLGYLTDDGLLYIGGRVDDQLNVAGNKVNPLQIESVLAAFPGVRESAALMVVQGAEGPMLLAALLLNQPIDLAALARFSQSRLALLSPQHFLVMTDFPRTPNGKVLRSALLQQAQQQLVNLAEQTKTQH